jgi:hypothetical protein
VSGLHASAHCLTRQWLGWVQQQAPRPRLEQVQC